MNHSWIEFIETNFEYKHKGIKLRIEILIKMGLLDITIKETILSEFDHVLKVNS